MLWISWLYENRNITYKPIWTNIRLAFRNRRKSKVSIYLNTVLRGLSSSIVASVLCISSKSRWMKKLMMRKKFQRQRGSSLSSRLSECQPTTSKIALNIQVFTTKSQRFPLSVSKKGLTSEPHKIIKHINKHINVKRITVTISSDHFTWRSTSNSRMSGAAWWLHDANSSARWTTSGRYQQKD